MGAKTDKVIYGKKLDQYLDQAKKILKSHSEKIMLPIDIAYDNNGRKEIGTEDLPAEFTVSDIGSKTIDLYKDIISGSGTVFSNGPTGVFDKPETEKGIKEFLTILQIMIVFRSLEEEIPYPQLINLYQMEDFPMFVLEVEQ